MSDKFGVGGVICHDCGKKLGTMPKGHRCSSYMVDCPYCGQHKEGTEQRDYRYPAKPKELFHGTINQAHIHPRIILQKALQHNAAGLILAHNHPSGSTTPSEDDKQLTTLLRKTLLLVDITLIDHFIIGRGDVYSFAEHGLL